MHKLLDYQIRQHLGDVQNLPPGFEDFLKSIAQTYRDYDRDFDRIEKAYEQVAHELETQARQKELILHSAGSGIVGVDIDGNISFFNPAALRILGYSPQDLQGKSFHNLLMHSHENGFPYAEETSPLRQAMTHSACYRKSKDVFWKKNGDAIHVDYTCTPVLEQATVRGAVVVFKNISEQIRIQQELERYNLDLEESKKNLEEFNAIASHDLREPLRKIKTFSEIIKNDFADRTNEKERSYLSKIISASERMDLLISHLLEFSRAGIKSLKMEEIDLKGLIQDSVSFLDLLIQKTDGKIAITCPTGIPQPFIFADRNQMHQLFTNLISNSLKYHRAGSPPEINIHIATLDNDFLKVNIQDNGIGFEESHAKRIFKPFERLHGRNEYEGVGMGLAICQKIVTRHGGTISVISRPGQGSIFILTLPSSVPAAEKSDSQPFYTGPKEIKMEKAESQD